MPLSRLDNFLKNTKGNILYVSPNDIDSTDSYENRGNSLTRPFKTIQRALLEAARFSYQAGINNDLFSKTTILLYPGDHIVDNRPGWVPYDNAGQVRYYTRDGQSNLTLAPLTSTSNLNLEDPFNDLYKLNSIRGGVILPRGTSLVGLDLRKTKIKPKYVPDPENDNIERSAVFRVTGTSYLWQFSIFDADPNSNCYKNYLSDLFVPNFSHHKLTAFEFVDGANKVSIKDEFYPEGLNFEFTDLDMYYQKVGDFYDTPSGRPVEPDYPAGGFDFETNVDEFRIVGPTAGFVGVSSIRSGNGTLAGANSVITVTLTTPLSGLDVDTPFSISNVNSDYNGQYVVSGITSYIGGTKEFTYNVQNTPANPLPSLTNAIVDLSTDTVTSASPYIFNISLRSVYGMCGLHADGSKVSGFKSMVVAQFTGIGLQKDENAFTIYDNGIYLDAGDGQTNLHKNSRAVFKPNYRNYHIKASNNSFIQVVSVFAIGFADHFLVESGGDMSITNSNSNFGARSLRSVGFRDSAFSQDNVGYITHIIPPQEINKTTSTTEFSSVDVSKTISVGISSYLYLYGETNLDSPPSTVIDGYRVGSNANEKLYCLISDGITTKEYSARVVMPSGGKGDLSQVTSAKKSNVNRNISGINSITSNTITFTSPHNFISGESVRVYSDSGFLPDGITENRIYYAIVNQNSGVGNTSIQLAETKNQALGGNAITINNNGGSLTIESRVSDKRPGDVGHPVQFDSIRKNWYINVSSASTDNNLYSNIVGLGTTSLGQKTPSTFIRRQPDTRNTIDKLYRIRYVIPKEVSISRPPVDGYIIQESSTTIESGQLAITDDNLSNTNVRKNLHIISGISSSLGIATVYTEIPHNLSVGSKVTLHNVKSTKNTAGAALSAYNRTFAVSGISSAKQFTFEIDGDPGYYQNNANTRDVNSLAYFERESYKNTYYAYRSEEVKKHIPNQQDGVYHVICVNASNSPIAPQFVGEKFSQNIQYLYPQTDRDNIVSDFPSAKSYAKSDLLGKVVTNNPKYSISKETAEKFIFDSSIGFGITNIVSTSSTTHTVYTKIDHGFNGIRSVGITSSGQGYGSGSGGTEYLYNASLIGFAGSTTGKNATAILTVNSVGSITNVKIVDPGSGYGIGNTLAISGVANTTTFFAGYLTVNSIADNTNDVIQISGVSSEGYSSYNNLYRISGIATGSYNQFIVSSENPISGFTTVGVGLTLTQDAFGYVVGKSLNVSSFTYDSNLGIATVKTIGIGNTIHGLLTGNKVKVVGAGQTLYNGSFVVKEVLGISTVVLNVGVATESPTATGDIYLFRDGFTSQSGSITINDENLGGRMVAFYAGISTILSADITNTSTTSISISNYSSSGLRLGDYIQVNSEIMRISDEVPLTVFRGVMGSVVGIHSRNTEVRKIRVIPTELRRHSIIRASNHTFEYLGFGPGNYSTAFPDKQDRVLSSEERLISQSTKQDGGLVVYTGMNDRGDFYVGNKKINSSTGQEEVFDSPIPTVTGEEIGGVSDTAINIAFDVITPLQINASRNIVVEGGPDKDIISQFDGPVIFNSKITSNSIKGIEAYSLYLQGDAEISRKITVGISTPTVSGNLGDITNYTSPKQGEYAGWIYTQENTWKRYSPISLSLTSNDYKFDKLGVGVGTTTILNNPFQFGFQNPTGGISTAVVITGVGLVGVGTTNPLYPLHVYGDVRIAGNFTISQNITATGNINASAFFGDGSGLSNLPSSEVWLTSPVGIHTLRNVGIGTTNTEFAKLTVFNESGSGVTTALDVHGESRFIGTMTVGAALTVKGQFLSTSFDLIGVGRSTILAGITTTMTLDVKESIKMNTLTLRESSILDVEGRARFKSYTEAIATPSISSNVLTLDLLTAQTFNVTLNQSINSFVITNVPTTTSTTFLVKLTQDGTGGRTVTFTFQGANLYWAGGVVPTMTSTSGKTDLYSFTTLDGTNYYGITGGQNF